MTSEVQLSGVLSEFARTMVTDFPIQAILDRLVERIVEVLPISAAGVTLISAGSGPRYVAASGDAALRFERLQTELSEGPCLEAYRAGQAVSVADLREEPRFPMFTCRAIEEGLLAVFAFPLRHGDGRLGALDLYRETPGPLAAEAMDGAQTLADVATSYLLNAQARVDLEEAAIRAREDSLHDALTGLPNRVLFLEHVEHALNRHAGSDSILAVLFIDLDRFKAVNDAYGHQIGDELLVAVARRLSGLLRSGDTLARLSGDEFVILCEDLDGAAVVDKLADRLKTELDMPFFLSGIDVDVSASVGIAFSGPETQVAEQILHHADTAMYEAKRRGGACHQVLDIQAQNRVGGHASLAHDLGGAVARHEFRLMYQPVFCARTGHIAGVETLARWAHPERGMVSPAVFIPLAEQSGLITDIGRWVMDQACRDRSAWGAHRKAEDLKLYLNVSVHQLMSPNFAATVAEVLVGHATAPATVILEVTESAFIQDRERAMVVLGALKELGLSLALDDFGTGFSSLSHLRHFPVDVVKIDQTFVAGITTDAASHAIVSSVIDLCHNLGMTVVAEGVETDEQHAELLRLGCDFFQGYHLSRPLTAAALDRLVGEPQR